ncbi:cytochrome P450 1A2-like [Haliotis rubra]|uniref:cytochrome P450 1A2-like n=1 Tax=Haliotis rubra TaxID=36100 RepID=UPI001EE5B5EB|nr:cytochrome P450 1A2-like [Haliotis rubra]XP_046561768.1 cytochrome P450 1A2-like [Haliotis rubra]
MVGQHSSAGGMAALVSSMEIQVAVATFIASFATIKLFRYFQSNNNAAPGPWGYPVLGHLPLLGTEPHVTFQKLRMKFGDVFRIQLGTWPALVINGKKAIKEALVEQGDAFSGRPQFYTTSSSVLYDGQGVSFSQFSQDYLRHRKMANKVLATFANAKSNPMEEAIHREIDTVVDSFASKRGTSFCPHDDVFLAAGSIIYQICYGRQEDIRERTDFTDFILQSKEFTETVSTGNPIDIFPWLRFVIPWTLTNFRRLIKKFIESRKKKVEEHVTTFDRNHLRDATDGFVDIVDSNSEDVQVLGSARIFSTIDDLFGAGFGTVATTMEWATMYMADNPQVQAKVQQEIDDVVGPSRRPTLEDRGKMVYTEACIHEIMRITALAPLSLPHYTTTDITFQGYSVKKDTVVFINLYSMSHDPDVWGDPEVFRPERFLDSSGQINKALLEEFLPFATGRRKCLGEFLGRMEIFLFFTGLLQKCSFSRPPEVAEYDYGVGVGFVRNPKPFDVQVTLRY